MTKQQRHRYEMLGRVQAFGIVHKDAAPESSMGSEAFAAVAAAVEAIEQHHSQRIVAAAEARKVKAAMRAALVESIKTVAQAARRITVKEAVNPFRIPHGRSTAVLVSTARAFSGEAEKRQDEFIRRGLPAGFVSELRALATQLADATEARQSSRAARRRAGAGVEGAIGAGLDAVRELDVFVPQILRADPARVAAWRTARRVDGGKSAPARRAPEPTTVLERAS